MRDGKDIDREGVAGSIDFGQSGVFNSIEIWRIRAGKTTPPDDATSQ